MKNQRGIALFFVLWVLTLLAVIAGEFCHVMRTEVNIARNFKEMTQSYYIAQAGLNQALVELIKSETTPFRPPAPEESQEVPEIEWRINAEIPPFDFAGGQFEVRIENESGKININRADDKLLRMMLNSFSLDESEVDVIVDSILDWRDTDNLHRLNGAEDDYYEALPKPYKAKNGDFDAIEELLLVRGISPELFNRGLRDLITVDMDANPARTPVKPARRGKFNYGRINVNAASPRMLRSLPEMTDDLVDSILEFRKEADFQSLPELLTLVGADVYAAIAPFVALAKTPYYTIKAMGRIEGSRVRRGVGAVVVIDPTLKLKYRIVQWLDRVENLS